MPADADDSTDLTTTGGVLAPPAEAVRSSTDRERRLTEYIRAHTGADICVRLTAHVPTACVIPTSEEALIESDNADFSDEQARQLVDSVDADYLVLISTHPANVDNLPITDQLTADRAQQFGYALHELGHIRYTAIAEAAALLEDGVEEEYQEFVHGLWNSCEDAAIENQLALDQSRLAADRLELVNRSISTHAEDLPSDRSAQFTFRDAVEAALYDTGIYDTEVRDVLCDSDDDRATFASDADRQAFEQVEASIDEIVATILSTPDSLERADRVFAWWEADIKPLLDPSHRDDEDSDQAVTNNASEESTTDSENSSSSRSPPESTGSDEAGSESGDEQQREEAANDANTSGRSDNSKGDESDTTGTLDETGEPVEHGETASPESDGVPSPDVLPDPDEINTGQRQSTPGSDVLEYPDLGDPEDATALSSPRSDTGTDEEGDGASEPEERSHSQSSAETSDSTQSGESSDKGGEKSDSPENDTADDDGTPSPTESSNVAKDHETADTSSDIDTGPDSTNEVESNTAPSWTDHTCPHDETDETDSNENDQTESASASSENAADASGENGEQDDETGHDTSTSDAGQTESPGETSDSTNQTSLGSFSGTSGQVENRADGADGGSTSKRSSESSDSTQDDPSTGSENGDAPESEVRSGNSNPTDGLSDGAAAEDDDAEEDSTGTESGPHTESTEKKEMIESATEGEDVSTTKGERDEPERPERSEEITEERSEPTPIHAEGDGGLKREGALDTDRDAAHDEADRETPDERALKRDLDDVADAIETLDEQNGGFGAAPGLLSELTIMPDRVGSNALGVDERWREATADSEFVADALRKALRESRRDAHRSGVTSGTFDRQRAGALARGDVGAFRVPQYGEDKQYDLVILLDRSGSMRRHIKTAEDALMRFALACEDIGINVCVINLYSDEARLVKPFSVECEHVRESVYSRATSGGTPLADALGLGRELLEQRRNSPLVLVMTDGKPDSPDAYQKELTQSYAPVCGLTLVLNHPEGKVPERVARNERFYDRHVYVHDPSQLADRLDQFAVMFEGL